MSQDVCREAEPVEKDEKQRPRLFHGRCCKATVQHGICGAGRPPRPDSTVRWFARPGDMSMCQVCEEMWIGGHWATCPRDSRYWEEGA